MKQRRAPVRRQPVKLVAVLVVDPHPDYPQFDVQEIHYLTWKGTAIPCGRSFGEWAWVGRLL